MGNARVRVRTRDAQVRQPRPDHGSVSVSVEHGQPTGSLGHQPSLAMSLTKASDAGQVLVPPPMTPPQSAPGRKKSKGKSKSSSNKHKSKAAGIGGLGSVLSASVNGRASVGGMNLDESDLYRRTSLARMPCLSALYVPV